MIIVVPVIIVVIITIIVVPVIIDIIPIIVIAVIRIVVVVIRVIVIIVIVIDVILGFDDLAGFGIDVIFVLTAPCCEFDFVGDDAVVAVELSADCIRLQVCAARFLQGDRLCFIFGNVLARVRTAIGIIGFDATFLTQQDQVLGRQAKQRFLRHMLAAGRQQVLDQPGFAR